MEVLGVASLPSGEVRVEAQQTAGQSAWHWKIPGQTMKGEELKRMLDQLEEVGRAWSVAGEVELQGEGKWENDEVSGEVRMKWQAPEIRGLDGGLAVLQVRAEEVAEIAETALGRVNVSLEWEGMDMGGFQTEAGRVEAHRDRGAAIWKIEAGEVAVWGGTVKLRELEYDPEARAVPLEFALDELAAQEMAKFIPESLTSASGRVSGNVALEWTPTGGVEVKAGRLGLTVTESSQVLLAPQPGLFSHRVPAKIETLPRWLGPIARWMAVVNPARAELEGIEQGQRWMQVETLTVDLRPDGPAGGRTAELRLVAHPEGAGLVERIDFTVNVTGPWQELIQLGLDKRSSMQVGP